MNSMKNNKGIILAGGAGTRLHPLTKVISKQLLPIYNKPMIYYPLALLVDAGINDILIITTPEDRDKFFSLLKGGEDWGVKISYLTQEKPEGIAQAFLIAENWLNNSSVTLILGDNLFFGKDLPKILKRTINANKGASIFAYEVDEPNRFGVIDLDKDNKVTSIEEKPKFPKSNWAVTGLYVYNEDVCRYAKNLKMSKRGELEITDLLNLYRKKGKLSADLIGRGGAWLDTGSISDFYKTSNFVSAIENIQGFKIACLEEIAYLNKWINKKDIIKSIKFYGNCEYSNYLRKLIY